MCSNVLCVCTYTYSKLILVYQVWKMTYVRTAISSSVVCVVYKYKYIECVCICVCICVATYVLCVSCAFIWLYVATYILDRFISYSYCVHYYTILNIRSTLLRYHLVIYVVYSEHQLNYQLQLVFLQCMD